MWLLGAAAYVRSSFATITFLSGRRVRESRGIPARSAGQLGLQRARAVGVRKVADYVTNFKRPQPQGSETSRGQDGQLSPELSIYEARYNAQVGSTNEASLLWITSSPWTMSFSFVTPISGPSGRCRRVGARRDGVHHVWGGASNAVAAKSVVGPCVARPSLAPGPGDPHQPR
jgi:hypothetical protein